MRNLLLLALLAGCAHIEGGAAPLDATLGDDRDGIDGAADACPRGVEDFDGHQDDDGCPDLDNDGDGFPDVVDACPKRAGGLAWAADNGDGCPGPPDRDEDGVPDMRDLCPEAPGARDRRGCPAPADQAPEVRVTDTEIVVLGAVFFEADAFLVREEAVPLLGHVATVLAQRPDILRLEVGGWASDEGEAEYNLQLSERRATEVVTWLTSVGNVAPERLTARGYGEVQPESWEDAELSRARARRVVFTILEREPAAAGAGER